VWGVTVRAMQLRLFRHFVPLSVVLLASSDALLITGAFYQLLSAPGIGVPIVLRVSSFTVQFSAGLAIAAVTAMVSVGLYGHQSFVDFRLLLSKIAVASIIVLMLVSFSATYWDAGLGDLPDARSLPLKATLIWLICVSVTREYVLCDIGTRAAKTAGSRIRQRSAGGADRQAGRNRGKRTFCSNFVYRDARRTFQFAFRYR